MSYLVTELQLSLTEREMEISTGKMYLNLSELLIEYLTVHCRYISLQWLSWRF